MSSPPDSPLFKGSQPNLIIFDNGLNTSGQPCFQAGHEPPHAEAGLQQLVT